MYIVQPFITKKIASQSNSKRQNTSNKNISSRDYLTAFNKIHTCDVNKGLEDQMADTRGMIQIPRQTSYDIS